MVKLYTDKESISEKVNILDIRTNSGKFRINISVCKHLTMIMGESGVDKSYLFSVLQTLVLGGRLKNVVCINYRNTDALSKLKSFKNQLIVIDNSDILLDEKQKLFTRTDINNHYLLIGRDVYALGTGPYNLGQLAVSNRGISIEYPFIGLAVW